MIVGTTAALALLAACDANAGAGANAASPANAAIAAVKDEPVRAVVVPTEPGGAVPAAGIACPSTLPTGAALPASGRVLGRAGPGLALSHATVTADAAAAIPADLSGLAEVEPDERADTPVSIQQQDADPTPETPFTLICRYGPSDPPLMGRAVLLMPLAPRARGYRCTTRLAVGNDPGPARASCRPR